MACLMIKSDEGGKVCHLISGDNYNCSLFLAQIVVGNADVQIVFATEMLHNFLHYIQIRLFQSLYNIMAYVYEKVFLRFTYNTTGFDFHSKLFFLFLSYKLSKPWCNPCSNPYIYNINTKIYLCVDVHSRELNARVFSHWRHSDESINKLTCKPSAAQKALLGRCQGLHKKAVQFWQLM